CFDGYWKLSDKTAEAFRGRHLSVGDMASRRGGLLLPRRSQEGHDHLWRREPLSIRGREPAWRKSQGQGRGGGRETRLDVVGAGARGGGTGIVGVVVGRGGVQTDGEFLHGCIDRMAGYKGPRWRPATGKIQHRVLRDRISAPG